MKRTNKDSRIEIWNYDYINNVKIRNKEDENAYILQVEPGINSYIVEIVDRKGDE